MADYDFDEVFGTTPTQAEPSTAASSESRPHAQSVEDAPTASAPATASPHPTASPPPAASAPATASTRPAASAVPPSAEHMEDVPLPPPPAPAATDASRGPQCVEFDVGDARSGSELRPITYFPITSIYRGGGNDATVGDYVSSPYHANIDNTVGRRCAVWDSPNVAVVVERRYSELVALRRLLELQFPFLVIPPLLPKSTTDHAATAMQQEGERHAQRRRLKRFLQDIGRMPLLLFTTTLVQKFFHLPRDGFLSTLMPQVYELSALLADAHASITDCRPAAPDAGAIAAIASTTSSMLRSVVAWVQGSESSPASTAALEARVHAALRRNPGYTQWEPIVDSLNTKKALWKEAAVKYTAVLQAERAMCDDLAAISPACGDIANVMSGCEYLAGIRMLLVEEGSFVTSIAASHRKNVEQRYVRFVEWLLREAEWASAAIDTMEFVRCVHVRATEARLAPSRRTDENVGSEALAEYAQRVTTAARAAIDAFMIDSRRRVGGVLIKLEETSLAGIATEQAACEGHAIVRRIHSSDYCSSFQIPALR